MPSFIFLEVYVILTSTTWRSLTHGARRGILWDVIVGAHPTYCNKYPEKQTVMKHRLSAVHWKLPSWSCWTWTSYPKHYQWWWNQTNPVKYQNQLQYYKLNCHHINPETDNHLTDFDRSEDYENSDFVNHIDFCYMMDAPPARTKKLCEVDIHHNGKLLWMTKSNPLNWTAPTRCTD